MPKRSPPAPVTASLITNTVVRAAPTSTTNITGFFATIRGFSLTNDSFVARLMISGSNKGRARTPLEISSVPSAFAGCGDSTNAVISKHLPVQHLEMLNNRPKRKRRKIRQRANNNDGSNQQDHKQRTVRWQCTAGYRN